MKNSICILQLSFLLGFIALIPCQALAYKPLQYGLIIGLNLSDFYTSDAILNLNAGFNAGGFLRLALTKTIDIEPELYLSTKGTSVINNTLLVGNTNLNLTYLEIPVVAVFNINRLVNLQIGSYVSYLLAAQIKNVSTVNFFNFEQSPDIDNYNRLDAGVVVGIGLDVKSITMGMRYNLGLINVGKNQQLLGLNYNLANARNGVLNFYLAIGFNQHKRNSRI
jgi:hypothetical protein